jgi:DNA-directed RNA polymerase subunit K/omega
MISQTAFLTANLSVKYNVSQTYPKIILKQSKMSRLRRQISANTTNTAETKDLNVIKRKTGNVYESIAIIAKRANQINISLKEELHNKLEEFASHTDSLEEIHENKEQIEISRAYERMPNPALLATQEFLEDKIYYRKNEDDLFS